MSTIYLSNWSGYRTPGAHGPGRKWTIMCWAVAEAVSVAVDSAVDDAVRYAVRGAVDVAVYGAVKEDQPVRVEALDLLRSMSGIS